MLKFSFLLDLPDVELVNAPVRRCLLQVRISRNLELAQEAAERELAGRLTDLPVLETVRPFPIPGLETPTTELRVFQSADLTRKATFSSEFVAYETSSYQNRSAFLDEAAEVLAALADIARPARTQRIGLRYTNMFTDVQRLGDWIEPALLGWMPVVEDISETLGQQILHANLRRAPNIGVVTRCALLAVGEMLEPGLPPASRTSWVLDLDAYDENAVPGFDHGAIMSNLWQRAADAHRVFAWAAARFIEEQGRAQ